MPTYLMHHGIKGQRWGVRNYQNKDGSLTDAGRKRYGVDYDSKSRSDYAANKRDNILKGRSAGNVRAYVKEGQAASLRSKSAKYRKQAEDARNDKEMRDLGWGENIDAYAANKDRKAERIDRKASKLENDARRMRMTDGERRLERLNEKSAKYRKQAEDARNDKEMRDLGWGENIDAYASKKDQKAERIERKARAQEMKNQRRADYDRHTSTGRARAQNMLLGRSGAEFYRDARARGETRGRAFVESQLGIIVSRRRDRKVYGEATR